MWLAKLPWQCSQAFRWRDYAFIRSSIIQVGTMAASAQTAFFQPRSRHLGELPTHRLQPLFKRGGLGWRSQPIESVKDAAPRECTKTCFRHESWKSTTGRRCPIHNPQVWYLPLPMKQRAQNLLAKHAGLQFQDLSDSQNRTDAKMSNLLSPAAFPPPRSASLRFRRTVKQRRSASGSDFH